MSEAVGILKRLKDKIEGETWASEAGKRGVLTGIKMCIAKLENSEKVEVKR